MARVGRWFLVLAAVAPLLHLSTSHGRLMDPPSRSSMWRQGFPSPVNYADNQLFCGGFKHQWEEQEGRCGVCGDPYDGPRDHEPGGKFYTGIVTKTFTRGQVIDIQVELTAFHYGYFEFRLCPLSHQNETVGQGCFDRNVLKLVTPSDSGISTRYKLPPDPSIRLVDVRAKLPAGVTCQQCVLQWKYHAANSWGSDFTTGRGCVGCGPQEEFYGCADVTIRPPGGASNNAVASVWRKDDRRSHHAKSGAAFPDSPRNWTRARQNDSRGGNQQDDWSGGWNVGGAAAAAASAGAVKRYRRPMPPARRWVPPEPKSLDSLKDIHASLVGKCQAVGAWRGQAPMDDWCEVNCERGNCPRSHCLCYQGDAGGGEGAGAAAPEGRQAAWGSHAAAGEFRGRAAAPWVAVEGRSLLPKPSFGAMTRRSYQRSRARLRGGAGFGSDSRRAARGGGNWLDSHEVYDGDRRRSNSIPTEESMKQILAYSQQTFNSIKDQADAVYSSLMRDEGSLPTDGFLRNYRPYGKALNPRYDPGARMYVKRTGQNPYPWRPQTKSNSLVYNRPRFPSRAQSHDYFRNRGAAGPKNPNYNNNGFNDRTRSDEDLISKAQFVDMSANRRRKPQPKMAPWLESSGSGARGSNCIANGAWAGQAAMTGWCQVNCAFGNCPVSHCRCM